jgi:excinuclease ABC subunit C
LQDEPKIDPAGDQQSLAENIVDGKSLSGVTSILPHRPGVYLFKDYNGEILYVGKARDLKKRVSSYFQRTDAGSVKTRILVGRASDLEYMVTPTEKEALLLEASLIKKHRPRYNVVLRDDKNYPALRIDLRQPFPCIEVVRRFQKDGALYFGPYPSASSVRQTLKMLNQMFPLRQCKGRRLATRERPCLNYSMGQCQGPCADKISREEYRRMLDEVILFLQGKTDVLQKRLSVCMEEASAQLQFERAAYYRDRLRAVSSTLEKQHVVSDRFLDQDVIGTYCEPEGCELVILFIRRGVLVGQKDFDLGDAQGEDDEIISAFIHQYYGEARYVPDEILTPVDLDVGTILEEWLSELKGRHVRVWPAKRGDRRYLLDIARNNARERFTSRRIRSEKDLELLEALQQTLKLPRLPVRMACVDISNIQGRHAVGSVVVFSNGLPDKGSYRSFRIKSKQEPDDPGMMAEVVERLLKNEQEPPANLDLLVLDGGKSQLNRIVQVLKEAGMTDSLPVISIAKEREADRAEKGRGFYEKIYVPGRKNPVFFSGRPSVLYLLQRLRDEAHRFAISHYKKIHEKDLLTSELDNIPGVGPKRRHMLIQHFGSIEAVRRASAEEIQAVRGISQDLAEIIKEELARSGTHKSD